MQAHSRVIHNAFELLFLRCSDNNTVVSGLHGTMPLDPTESHLRQTKPVGLDDLGELLHC